MREIGRKVIHLMIIIILIIYIAIERTYNKQSALIILVAILILFIFLEYLRLELNIHLPFFSRFIREKERYRMYGVIFFLSGVIISLAVFEFRIAFAAILMATFGDLTSAIFGTRFGTTRLFKNKTAVGFFVGFITNILVGFLVLAPYYQFYIATIMALTASLIESFTEELDDNLLIPIITGFVGQLLVYLF